MALKPVKFFTWFALERILTKVARETPETVDEYLAWLRTIHIVALSVKSVFRASSNFLNIAPRSPLGETAYKTFVDVAAEYSSAAGAFPQAELERVKEVLEEVLPLGGPE